MRSQQLSLFEQEDAPERSGTSSTFAENVKLPVHRWFRYSAGFSARWAESEILRAAARGTTRVLDPFAGSGTTLVCAENAGVESYGVESHPFVARVARAKLARRSDPAAYRRLARSIVKRAELEQPSIDAYPALIRKCYTDQALQDLDRLRRALERLADGSPAAELAWLTLVGILRNVSHVGTAQWQYVLPHKTKKVVADPFVAFEELSGIVYRDMLCPAPGTQVRRPAKFGPAHLREHCRSHGIPS